MDNIINLLLCCFCSFSAGFMLGLMYKPRSRAPQRVKAVNSEELQKRLSEIGNFLSYDGSVQ